MNIHLGHFEYYPYLERLLYSPMIKDPAYVVPKFIHCVDQHSKVRWLVIGFTMYELFVYKGMSFIKHRFVNENEIRRLVTDVKEGNRVLTHHVHLKAPLQERDILSLLQKHI